MGTTSYISDRPVRIHLLDGRTVDCRRDWLSQIAELGLDCYVEHVGNTLEYCWDQAHQEVWDREGCKRLDVRRGNHFGSLIAIRTWGQQRVNSAVIADIDAVCQALGAGPQPSAAGAGMAALRNAHRGPVVSRPPADCCQALWLSAGARNDVRSDADTVHERLWEIDLRSAYPAVAARMPSGPMARILPDSELDLYQSYYALCKVTIRRQLEIGPFCVRDSSGRNSYPTEPGTYEAWLWDDEVRACREAGCGVDLQRGYGWTSWYSAKDWSAAMDSARRKFTKRQAAMVKLAAVGAIGCFKNLPRRFQASEILAQVPEGSVAVQDGPHGVAGYLMQGNWDHSIMPHWWSYIQMRVRLALYQRQIVEGVEHVVMADTDGLYLDREPVGEMGDEMGSWSLRKVHTNARVLGPRTLVSDQGRKIPGGRRLLLHRTA